MKSSLKNPAPAVPAGAKNTRIRLIATLPKSGTWLSHTFFWCYDQLLRHRELYVKSGWKPDLLSALHGKKIKSESSHGDTFGFERLYIAHTICPGYEGLPDPYYMLWDNIAFPLPYNWGEAHIRGCGDWDALIPALNSDSRIVYLYRNPLDHFVSYYNHSLTHADDIHRFHVLPDGTRRPIEGLKDFVFEFGILKAFIKHYHSFRTVRAHFPQNVLLMPYETLVADRAAGLERILSFLGTPVTEQTRPLFEVALEMTSKEALSAMEDTMNRSLVGDLSDSDRHIRSGETQKWHTLFDAFDMQQVESEFNRFELSLDDFDIFKGCHKPYWPYVMERLAKEEKASDPVFSQRIRALEEAVRESDRQKIRIEEAFYAGKNELARLKNELTQQQKALENIQKSSSWRLTKPLRSFKMLYNNAQDT